MPRPPPDLVDDAIAEILIRVSPDEPADLVRASLVCKLWRRLLSDPAFLSRYRRFHRTPPLFGFFHDVGRVQTNPGFVPTTAASPFHQSALQCHPCLVFDCRHGRVLLRIVGTDRFVVWDPITGHREELRIPCIGDPLFSAAVLCAASDCDHRDCHGGPFTVVYAGTDVGGDGFPYAYVYSSETSAWNVGAFTMELKSGRARKISEAKIFYFVVPFMTFCTPDSDCVKGKLLVHGEAH
ncbi:hypothetical protein QOZ80_7BG0585230 [Eleusine coracana subsp. coracana]|nr:hypothetical protein QOZ80_7BG0585230 [Eleusine coracana subsp. coracana]